MKIIVWFLYSTSATLMCNFIIFLFKYSRLSISKKWGWFPFFTSLKNFSSARRWHLPGSRDVRVPLSIQLINTGCGNGVCGIDPKVPEVAASPASLTSLRDELPPCETFHTSSCARRSDYCSTVFQIEVFHRFTAYLHCQGEMRA